VCIKKYLKFSESVFRVDRKMLVPVGEGYSRFSVEPLEKALKKVVFDKTHSEDTPLADKRDEICPVFVLSTRGKDAGPIKLFRSYGFYRDECPIWQAARATTAAPTYFPPAWVTVPSPPEWYVDGGVTQNNPSPFALKEGKELWKAKRCLLVSIGTGIQKRADLVGNKKTPKDDPDPKNDPTIETGPVGSHQSEEGNSARAGSTQTPKPKTGGMKVGLRKAATTVVGAFRKAARPIQPVADKAAQLGRFPGGFSTATRFLQELVKLSTESERTHGTTYAEAHSRDLSGQFRYHRFNVQNGMDDIGLEEWQNWDLMVSLTRNYLDSVDVPARLTECARDLLHPPGFESIQTT
jgi:predicted acylesterase/phospholipase RssA